jgi:hypothetical protein
MKVTGSEPAEGPRTGAKAAKTLGLAVGCSRLFPAVPGTRHRKRTARSLAAVPGEAISVLRPISLMGNDNEQ